MRYTHRVIGGLVITACATLAAQQTPARSSASGVYSAEQASAGEKVYFENCASCHGADLGGIERADQRTCGDCKPLNCRAVEYNRYDTVAEAAHETGRFG